MKKDSQRHDVVRCLIPALVENMASHTKTAIGARARTWQMYPYSCPSRQISPFLCSHVQNLSQECALAPRQKVIKRSWKKEKDRTFNNPWFFKPHTWPMV